MGTLGWCKDRIAKTAEDAVRMVLEENQQTVFFAEYSSKTLAKKINDFFAAIKKHNEAIDDINQQLLPTNPYHWDAIDGCLPVKCAEISVNTYANNAGNLALFSGWNYSVLSEPSAREPISMKALSSLAMLGYLTNN